MIPLIPTPASNGRTLLRLGPLRALQRLLERGIAEDPGLQASAEVVLRPLILLDQMWAEVDKVFANHPPAVDRLRVLLASAGGWQHWLAQLLQDDSALSHVFSSGSTTASAASVWASRTEGIVDEGALAVLGHAALRVSVSTDPGVALDTPFSLAFSAAPAEALSRVARDLGEADSVPMLLLGLDLAGSPPLPDTMLALLAAPEEIARWALLTVLHGQMRLWEAEDRQAFLLSRWEAATADAISEVEAEDGVAVVTGLDLSETGSVVVTFARPETVAPVVGTPDVAADGTVTVTLPDGFLGGWLGRQSPSLMSSTNVYRDLVRSRWLPSPAPAATVFAAMFNAASPVLQTLGVPVELIADITPPAAPPRTAHNQVQLGPVIVWVRLQPPVPEPGGTVLLEWASEGATAVEITHDGHSWIRKGQGRLVLEAPAAGSATVQLTPSDGTTTGAGVERSYSVSTSLSFGTITVTPDPVGFGDPATVSVEVLPAEASGELLWQYGDLADELGLPGPVTIDLPAVVDATLRLVLLDANGTQQERTATLPVETPRLQVVVRDRYPDQPPVLEVEVVPPVAGEILVEADGFETTVPIVDRVQVQLPATVADGPVHVVLSGAQGAHWDTWRGTLSTAALRPRRVVVIRSGVLVGDDVVREGTEALEAAAARAGVALTQITLPVVPDALAVLLETPRSGTRLLDALERLAVVAPGGEDAWWVAWVPGQAGLLEVRNSPTCQGLAVADVGSADGLMDRIAGALQALANEQRVLRLTGRVRTDRIAVDLVREEHRRLPAPRSVNVDRSASISVVDSTPRFEWVVRDASDLLFRVPFEPTPGPFAVLIPSAVEAVTVQLRQNTADRGAVVLFERNRSRERPEITFDGWNPPVIDLTYTHPGRRGARLFLELSQEAVWVGVAELDPCPGAARVALEELGGATEARLVAVDGWNTAYGPLDAALPTAPTHARIRRLADGSVTADAAEDFRWLVDGRPVSTDRAIVPPSVGELTLELGPRAAPVATLSWSPR